MYTCYLVICYRFSCLPIWQTRWDNLYRSSLSPFNKQTLRNRWLLRKDKLFLRPREWASPLLLQVENPWVSRLEARQRWLPRFNMPFQSWCGWGSKESIRGASLSLVWLIKHIEAYCCGTHEDTWSGKQGSFVSKGSRESSLSLASNADSSRKTYRRSPTSNRRTKTLPTPSMFVGESHLLVAQVMTTSTTSIKNS